MKMFIANWKMNLTLQEALSFCEQNISELKKLDQKLILCPPAPALTLVSQMVKDTEVAVCSQSCSAEPAGPFTGQISAATVAQAGCSYVLVGNNEERKAFNVSDEIVGEKALRTLEAGMIPVICIGEPEAVYNENKSTDFLENQLMAIKKTLKGASAYIAYEPIWAIGNDKTPTSEELSTIFQHLKSIMPKCAFLYGGSVNLETIDELNKVKEICGYLIGKASLDPKQLFAIINKQR